MPASAPFPDRTAGAQCGPKGRRRADREASGLGQSCSCAPGCWRPRWFAELLDRLLLRHSLTGNQRETACWSLRMLLDMGPWPWKELDPHGSYTGGDVIRATAREPRSVNHSLHRHSSRNHQRDLPASPSRLASLYRLPPNAPPHGPRRPLTHPSYLLPSTLVTALLFVAASPPTPATLP
jgi:hypothetical protein